jgi:hypothetical protein
MSEKLDVIERLVEVAIGLCEPENADEKATEYTRNILRKKFAAVMVGDTTPPQARRDRMKRDIPLDQAIELVRAAQKLNCDTGEQLHAAMAKRIKEADRLRRTIDKLRAALKPFSNIALNGDDVQGGPDMISVPDLAITPDHVRSARAALRPPRS